MAGKTNTSATFFAQKKLLGKAHTSNLKTDGEELIGSNIQAATSLTFGEEIPVSASLNLYTIQSASNGGPGTIEYVPFILTALTGTTYDANNANPDGGSGQDSGESSQSSGPHAYKFVFPSDYVSNSSNSRKGNGFFNNSKIVHETLGKVQLVPPFFSQQAPNPYIIKIYKDDGGGGIGDEIPLLDNIDWNVDFYNGILFLQDYNSSKVPAHARAFAYVGKMAEEVISSASNAGGGGGTPGGSSTQVQFNDGGSFAGDSGLVFNKSTNTLTANNLSGSLTKLSDGTSFIKSSGNINIVSESNGSVIISTPEYVFNEYLGLANGSNTLFSLDSSPTSAANVSVYVNGLLQMPATSITSAPFQDYSITGSNIYFTSGSIPYTGSLLMANYTKNS